MNYASRCHAAPSIAATGTRVSAGTATSAVGGGRAGLRHEFAWEPHAPAPASSFRHTIMQLTVCLGRAGTVLCVRLGAGCRRAPA